MFVKTVLFRMALIAVCGMFPTIARAQNITQSNTGSAAAKTDTVKANATAPTSEAAVASHAEKDGAAAGADTIPVGTTITMQNWRQYRDSMPDGMAAFFEGRYAWKMPQDVAMEVGPTIIHPLPKGYLEATEKYASQVRLVELPDGGLTLQGYQGGIPFPNPAEPHKGWKILTNLWYRYLPHLSVVTYGSGCLVDKNGSFSCKAASIVHRQLAFNTDPGVPATIPGAGDKFYTQWLMVLEPEQDRYTATLTISYTDPGRPEDSYVFIPSLRRYQRVSTLARCSPNQGTDSNLEDYRFGFDSNITELNVDYLGEKKILALVDYQTPAGRFPEGFDMPLGWPKPSWGKWQVRDVDVLSVSKIPSKAQGYCYGKRVIYVDKASSAPVWEDLYDSKMQPWRSIGLFLHTVEVPQVGPVNASGALIYAFWDVQSGHATFFINPTAESPFYVNEQAPKDYFDLTRYTDPNGLNLIMR